MNAIDCMIDFRIQSVSPLGQNYVGKKPRLRFWTSLRKMP